ncbi:cytochrome c oxidase subunit 4 [Sphingomonas gellani]|uniref:Cytochrome c oxidase subunit 4 n=1 Tax=Sphingomonas gellani TaxID=1166340 RepID=A0A1H7ZFS1_9SPHN|nr:cytochrome C oxidase subunit IV family protein [Sphingomonas gellani]SEM57111.1 cytochrome c oxidase subunit 4 [Sphingomonas gellani]
MTREQRAQVIGQPLRVFAGLLALLLVTFGYAYLPGGPLKTEVALAVAAAKALLIATFFMQLRQAVWLVRLAALGGLVWACFLYIITFSDYLTR